MRVDGGLGFELVLRFREGVFSIVTALNGCFDVQLAIRFSARKERGYSAQGKSLRPFLDNS